MRFNGHKLVTAFLTGSLLLLSACDSGTEDEGEIIITEIEVGSGDEIAAETTIIIEWEGRLSNGNVFDSSELQGQDLIFTVGVGKVIPGLDEGILGMRIGGMRRIEIPPSKAFGRAGSCQSSGNCAVPSNETVTYDVEVLDRLDTVLVENREEGTGPAAKTGDLVNVEYIAATLDGDVVDASELYGGPLQLRLGAGHVIDGWEIGIPGMKVGGVRILTVPPELGYGGNANGSVPPWSVLVFRIQLAAIVESS